MFTLKLFLKPILLATLFIFGLAAVGPNAALAKKVKGKGTVEILVASGKDEPAKKKVMDGRSHFCFQFIKRLNDISCFMRDLQWHSAFLFNNSRLINGRRKRG